MTMFKFWFKKILPILIVFVSQQLYSQRPSLSTVAMPSPNAASLIKFEQIPVRNYTGVPNIEVPLFDIISFDCDLKISLSYNSNGIKVEDEASLVGLGWALNAGGVIQKIEGTNAWGIGGDGLPCTPITNSTDSYVYNFDGNCGRFYLNPSGKGIIAKQEDLDIQKLSNGFMVKTPTGKIYLFTSIESSTNAGVSWYLTSVTSPNSNTLTFEYESAVDYDFLSLRTSKEIITGLQSSSGVTITTAGVLPPLTFDDPDCATHRLGSPGAHIPTAAIESPTKTKTLYLKKISSEFGKVDFLYSDRNDLNYPNATVPKKLESIILSSTLNNNNSQVKKYTFDFDYTDYNNLGTVQSKRLRLLGIKEWGQDNNNFKQLNTFQYNALQLPEKTSKNQDHWGYYNGPINNTSLHPIEGSNREPNETYTHAGLLQSITYPTGGKTIFEFESNDYSNKGSTGFKKGGGIRIKKIIDTDGTGSIASSKRYEYLRYDANGTAYSSGKLIYSLSYFVDRGYILEHPCSGTYRKPCVQNCPNPYQNYIVTNFNSVASISIVARSHYSQPTQLTSFEFGVPVGYDKVTVYEEGLTNKGKTVYEYLNNEGNSWGASSLIYGVGAINVIQNHDNGNLLKKTVYSFDLTNNTYNKVSVEENTYENVNVKPIGFYLQKAVTRDYSNNSTSCNLSNLVSSSFDSYWTRLKTSTLTEFSTNNNSNPLVTTKQYSYRYTNNPKNFLISKIYTTINNNQNIEEQFKYPEDFTTSNTVYANMVSKNIYSPIIEYSKVKNGNLLYKENHIFKDDWFADNHISGILTSQNQFGNTNLVDINIVDAYDIKGNIKQFTKQGISTSYIWDYQLTQPIAEVKNASQIDIAYTSFEADGTGGWEFSNTSIVNSVSVTGKNCFNLSSGILTSFLPVPGKKYKVSYWYQVGSTIFIGSCIPLNIKIGPTKNGWTYTEFEITGTHQIDLTGAGLIDEVRLYPESALMSTATYNPLIGVTSKCDENNHIIRYEYDEFNRLSLIRDQDNNILKKICYNYSGQLVDCNIICPPSQSQPDWQNTTTSPTCEQNICGNTGYQLQQQMDMNTCSPTSGTTRFVQVFNPTACPANTLPQITYQNFTNQSGYSATYTNLMTGQVFTFAIPASSSGTLGCIPAGKYSVNITKPNAIGYYNFGNGCANSTGSTAYFAKVLVPACSHLTIDWEY